MNIKPVVTEKTVRNIEIDNTLVFNIPRKISKEEIKRILEKTLNVKIESVRTSTRVNKKYAVVKLEKNFKAIDIATKLGMM